MGSVDFILGGVRSGKSAYAERLAIFYRDCGDDLSLHYLATCVDFDESLRGRIDLHRERRVGFDWVLHEESLDIDLVLGSLSSSGGCVVLLDSLDMWVNNILHYGLDFVSFRDRFLCVVSDFDGILVIVSSEVGLSLLPSGVDGRLYCDLVGGLNCAVGLLSDCSIFVVSGFPICLRGELRDI